MHEKRSRTPKTRLPRPEKRLPTRTQTPKRRAPRPQERSPRSGHLKQRSPKPNRNLNIAGQGFKKEH
eukprot:1405424-Alexandrium_andersonii.AAC.1